MTSLSHITCTILITSAIPALAQDMASELYEAHGGDSYYSKEALAADVEVDFGGNRIIDGEMIFATNFTGSRIEQASGVTAVWDGESAWISPSDGKFPRARFHLLTWPYFLVVPFKVGDPGANLEPLGTMTLQGSEYDAAKLTFGEGVGDAPDDWYILYQEPESGHLAAMAYIVTYSADQAEAEKEPHAIVYHDYQEIDGTYLSTRWSFYNWSEEQGIFGDAIGEVRLNNIQYTTAGPGAFNRPADAREDELPK